MKIFLKVWAALCVGVLVVSAYICTDAVVYDGKLILADTFHTSGQCPVYDDDILVTRLFQ